MVDLKYFKEYRFSHPPKFPLFYCLGLAIANIMITFYQKKDPLQIGIVCAFEYAVNIVLNQYYINKRNIIHSLLRFISESFVVWSIIIGYSKYPYICVLSLILPLHIYNYENYEKNIKRAYVYTDNYPVNSMFDVNKGDVNFKSVFGRNALRTIQKYENVNEFITKHKNAVFGDLMTRLESHEQAHTEIIYNIPDNLVDDLIAFLNTRYDIIYKYQRTSTAIKC